MQVVQGMCTHIYYILDTSIMCITSLHFLDLTISYYDGFYISLSNFNIHYCTVNLLDVCCILYVGYYNYYNKN